MHQSLDLMARDFDSVYFCALLHFPIYVKFCLYCLPARSKPKQQKNRLLAVEHFENLEKKGKIEFCLPLHA